MFYHRNWSILYHVHYFILLKPPGDVTCPYGYFIVFTNCYWQEQSHYIYFVVATLLYPNGPVRAALPCTSSVESIFKDSNDKQIGRFG